MDHIASENRVSSTGRLYPKHGGTQPQGSSERAGHDRPLACSDRETSPILPPASGDTAPAQDIPFPEGLAVSVASGPPRGPARCDQGNERDVGPGMDEREPLRSTVGGDRPGRHTSTPV